MSCGVGCRHGLDPALLWLLCRLAATALIQHLAWELPYAVGAALKREKKKKKKRTYIWIDLSQEIRSHNHGGLQVPHLLFTNWRPKKPMVWFDPDVKVWGPEAPRQGKMNGPAQAISQEKIYSWFLQLFVLFRPQGDWMDTHPHWG